MISSLKTQSSVLNPLPNNDDDKMEPTLRPQSFAEVIGRKKEKKNLKIMIESAKMRKKSLDHILFHGPPGLGKTSFAHVIAKELNSPMYVTNGSAIERSGDLAAILTGLEPFAVVFIDEIHRLRINIEEMLYPVMEDNVLDVVIGKGPSAKTLRLNLPQITIIGATTKMSSISSPLRDRFGMHIRLDFYNDEELFEMIKQKARIIGIEIETDAATEIAKRARMTARIAIRILKRVRDYAVINNATMINKEMVVYVLELMGIDDLGLDETDRNLLKIIIHNFDNKPVGLNTLAVAVSEDESTIENVYEPFLIKKGLIKRTPRGRVATQYGVDIMLNHI